LLVVSHDRRLLETVCERLWVVDGGSAVAFDGGYRAWRTAVADGWTVAGAIEAEARRLRTGGRPVAGTVVTGGGTGADPTNGTAPADPRRGWRTRVVAGVKVSRPATRAPKLSKEAYRRQKTALDAELTRLGLRK